MLVLGTYSDCLESLNNVPLEKVKGEMWTREVVQFIKYVQHTRKEQNGIPKTRLRKVDVVAYAGNPSARAEGSRSQCQWPTSLNCKQSVQCDIFISCM